MKGLFLLSQEQVIMDVIKMQMHGVKSLQMQL